VPPFFLCKIWRKFGFDKTKFGTEDLLISSPRFRIVFLKSRETGFLTGSTYRDILTMVNTTYCVSTLFFSFFEHKNNSKQQLVHFDKQQERLLSETVALFF
jgi:hypothetical protein